MADLTCDPSSPSYPKWTVYDALMWKIAPEKLGGGRPRLDAYKDGWIAYNKARILDAAKSHAIPADLLGCVAYNEVGGDPPFVKRDIVLPLRQFDWSGPDWVDRHLTIFPRPSATSEGAIKIQLRAAARQLGLDPDRLSYSQQNTMTRCLEVDVFNLDVVASLLRSLLEKDFPDADPNNLTDDQFAIVGSRYNRGDARPLADFIASLRSPPGAANRKYSEYGRAMLTHRAHVRPLLGL